MSNESLPSLFERHWAESALAIGAVVVAAVSLWVAFNTERTNQQMVAAASWPFVQLYESSSSSPPLITLALVNSGIGPAKIESFQVFWKGRPQRSPWELLHSCCGLALQPDGVPDRAVRGGISTSSDEGMVLRAGQTINLLAFKKSPATAAIWNALLSQFSAGPAKSLAVRYCYCSAFNQCWRVTGGYGHAPGLNPPEVPDCPKPKVSYQNYPASD